jgi:hypothetical protein
MKSVHKKKGDNIMGKYMVLWEIDHSKIPVDPKERGAGWGMLMALVRQDFEKGVAKDWGAFLAEANGYAVYEGTEIDVMKALQQYVPFCLFEVHPIATEDRVNEMITALTG